MTMPLSCPHTHTTYCDGRSTAREMVDEALRQGFVSLGFSGHAKQTFDPKYSMDEEREAGYLRDIRALQDEYKGRFTIWRGLERDVYSVAERAPFEYVIGAVHYLPLGDEKVAADGNPVKLSQSIKENLHGDGLAFARLYYQMLGDYIADYRPDIIAHFDLLTKHNGTERYFDADSPDYLRLAFDALDKAYTGCQLLEINTGNIARYGAAFPYPAMPLLERWHKPGGDVIISSDCHLARDLSAGYDKALAAARAAGFERVLYLGDRDRLFEAYNF